jgi:iron complex outermembrane receptor protein
MNGDDSVANRSEAGTREQDVARRGQTSALGVAADFRESPMDNGRMPQSFLRFSVAAGVAAVLFMPFTAYAQSAPQVTLPTVTVTAQKEPADAQTLPVSVTAVPSDWLSAARITWIADAAIFAPNVVITEFTARKLSNPRVRGIGASPANPAVTTYVDGVPVLNANASSMEFTGVEQVEFVRGPQSALFGRNAIGGVISFLSERPSLSGWDGEVVAPLGNFDARDVRGRVSGPLGDRVAVAVAGGRAQREGFSVNTLTGNDIDSREATFAKAQLLVTPSSRWQTRLVVSGERAEDGDYALNDLAAVRATPFQVARDFEGYTHRNLFNTTLLNRYEGARFSLTSTTGIVRWDTDDQTDLDYTPLPLATRSNLEKAVQFTQEVRVASSPGAGAALSPAIALKWQAGLSVFAQDYEQDAVNTLAAFTVSPLIQFPVQQTNPRAALDDAGVGLYGQATMTFADAFDLIVGARFDRERKDARLETFFTPAIAAPVVVDAERTFANVSPQVAVAYRVAADRMVYASATRGFKAGGFNPASPAGREAFGDEQTWNFEGGVKTTFAGGRVFANAVVFATDWQDLQLNLPNPEVPAQFFVSNVGSASSRGAEVELVARPRGGVDVFASLGYNHARFGDDTASGGRDVSGKRIPFTPAFTFSLGAQLSHDLTPALAVYGRGELATSGEFHYDEANSAAQEAYSLVNLRAGLRGRLLFGEAWVRNAFDTRYVPVALAYPGFAPSGFVGEPGRPRTFGVSVGVSF